MKQTTMASQDIERLKELVKQQDAEGAYAAGLALSAQHPTLEYASYATAWAAARLGRDEECLRAIDPALVSKPTNPAYLSLRAHARLRLGRHEDALPDFLLLADLRPAVATTWRALLQIQRALSRDLALPRNLVVVADEIGRAFAARQWDACDRLLAELATLQPLVHRYWELRISEFFNRLEDPLSAWQRFHDEATAGLAHAVAVADPLLDRSLPAKAFQHFFACVVKAGNSSRALSELERMDRLYGMACPVSHLVGAAALLIRDGLCQECLTMLDAAESRLANPGAQADFRLKVYSSRWACRQQILTRQSNTTASELENTLSDGLVEEMMAVARPGSWQRLVLDDFLACWRSIRARGDRLLLDLRFNKTQLAVLQDTIRQALVNREPLCLMRLGDGEAYGFETLVSDIYRGQPPLDVDVSVETLWWGRSLDPQDRAKLRAGFIAALETADVIGLPGALRMARDLGGGRRVHSELPSVVELKHRVLFCGMQAMLLTGRVKQPCTWVDEFCNIALSAPEYLKILLDAATSVVVVSCFDVPPGHLLSHPKVLHVLVPPARKMVGVAKGSGSAILPEVLPEVAAEVARLAGPGTLVLVSAGFAGKGLLGVARQAGAVAIDFGSGMDALMGLQTRSLELGAQAPSRVPQQCAADNRLETLLVWGQEQRYRMEDLNQSARDPLMIHERSRLATVTSVKLLSPDTLVCCSFVGRRAYLVKFDQGSGAYEILDSVDTTFEGRTVETDTCDTDGLGLVATSNFYLGSCSLYRCEDGRIRHLRDLHLGIKGYVHGVKFHGSDILAVTAATGPTGVHFFDISQAACRPLLHLPSDLKTQDVCFLSPTRAVVMGAAGAPMSERRDTMYDSQIQIVDFCLQDRTFEVVASAELQNAHVDCCMSSEGRVLVSDQYNNRVNVLDATTLELLGTLEGYDFPHGLDIRFGMLAVTNYGRNDVTLRPLASRDASAAQTITGSGSSRMPKRP